MRVPKFRAWDVREKKMFTNDQLIIWSGNVYANDNSKLKVDNLKGWNIDEKYLMQSTGLKDKNGKEIFEGDVVELHRFTKNYHKNGGLYEGEETLVGAVIYGYTVDDIKYFGKVYPPSWLFKNRYRELDFSDFSGIHEESFKVIGNIYQNPELIEKVEE